MKLLFTLLAILCCLLPATAQTMDSLFVKAPAEVLPMLDRTARLNMLDYFNSGMEAVAENSLGGRSVLTRKDSSRLSIRTTEASEMEIVWLRERRLILCLQTLRLPARQTYLQIYDEAWRRRSASVPEFTLKDFLNISDNDYNTEDFQQAMKNVPPLHYVMEWNIERNELKCALSLERVYSDDLAPLKPYLIEKWLKLEDVMN